MSDSTPPISRDRSDEDAEIVRRLIAQDGRALASLYDRFGGVVYSLALRIVRVPGDAEEVTQEVFLYAWQKGAMFDVGRGTLLTWLCAIARSRAIDRKRAQQSHERRKDALARETEARPAVALGPDRDASVAQIGKSVRVALARLPAEQRQAIEIAYFEGLSQSEIAARLGAPLGTIKTRMRQGLIRLRAAMLIDAKGWQT